MSIQAIRAALAAGGEKAPSVQFYPDADLIFTLATPGYADALKSRR